MGALGGHMAHLHESMDLTFDELSTIMDSVANADISATEKVDGQNLFLTVKSDGSINTARNGGDLKKGGMTPEEFAAKWRGHPAESAFTKGFEAISQAIRDLDQPTLNDLFADGARYVNMEVMYPGNPNMVVYDAGNVVLHNFQTFDQAGKPVEDPEARAAFQQLVSAVDEAESDVDGEAWLVKGPVIAQLQKLADGTALEQVQDAIERIASPVGMSATLGDLAELRLRATAVQAGIPEGKVEQIMDAAFARDGAVSVREIKKGLTKEQQSLVSKLATKANARKAIAATMKPLELAITDFAVEVLRGMESYFVSDTDKELSRQREELSRAIQYLEGLASSGDDSIGKLVDRQLEKLTDIESQINSTMEGIVFEYPPGSGELKKLTGAFAMMNQLVGRARRAGMPSDEVVEESYGRSAHSVTEATSIYDQILMEQSLDASTKSIGLVPMAAKPYHAGHHTLVEFAAITELAEEAVDVQLPINDEVLVFISFAGRGVKKVKDPTDSRTIKQGARKIEVPKEGQTPIFGKDIKYIWNNLLKPNLKLPSKVKIMSPDDGTPPQPVRSVHEVCKALKKAYDAGESTFTVPYSGTTVPVNEAVINIYSDDQDIKSNYPDTLMIKEYGELWNSAQAPSIRGVGVPRTSTVEISGTQMRQFLCDGDIESFTALLPPLPEDVKDEIGQILTTGIACGMPMDRREKKNESNRYSLIAHLYG